MIYYDKFYYELKMKTKEDMKIFISDEMKFIVTK